MMIKKFVAPSLKEAMAQTKKELGQDAVILKSSKIKTGGMFDFSGKEAVEILAAVDTGTKPIIPPGTGSKARRTAQKNSAESQTPPAFARSGGIVTSPGPATYTPKTGITPLTVLQAGLNDLKQEMAEVSSFLKYHNVPALPRNLQDVMKQLLDNEVDTNIARSLVEEIHTELTGEQHNDMRLVLSKLLNKIGAMVKTAGAVQKRNNQPRTVMLVGPTGVGKTTTIAKLATNQKLLNKKKVALISADTFRIGAIDQLKTFANIAEIPLTVVYSADDMRKAVKNYGDMDVIYIDTTGRSQRDNARLNEMQKIVGRAQADEIHLALSATTRLRDLKQACDKYARLKYNRLLLTKIDETASLGIILNLLAAVSCPVSYIATGQNVPEDIERATAGKLARMIVRRKSN